MGLARKNITYKNINEFDFSVRVIAVTPKGLVGQARRLEFVDPQEGIISSFPMKFSSSIIGPIKLAPIGPNDENVLIVATADGFIHAILPNGTELKNFPVHSKRIDLHLKEQTFSSGQVSPKVY